jgi:hypothetical protein
MSHDPSTCVPVYHTQTPSHDLVERDAAAWVRFGLDVMAAHQPDGDTCQGCGRTWDRCLVVVAARRNGLADLLPAGPGTAHATLPTRFPTRR